MLLNLANFMAVAILYLNFKMSYGKFQILMATNNHTTLIYCVFNKQFNIEFNSLVLLNLAIFAMSVAFQYLN